MMQAELPAFLEQDFIGALHRCRLSKDTHQAARLQVGLHRVGLESHPVLGNHLIPALVDCGNLPGAQLVFDSLSPCDCNEYSWTSLISGYIGCGDPRRALDLYHHMQPVLPNRVTYLALLNACASWKDAESGKGLHSDIVCRGLETDVFMDSALIGNTLVDMYGKCGSLADARHILKRLPIRSAVSWSALIAGCAEHMLDEEVQKCLQEMQQEGISPDSVTFICSLRSCRTTQGLETGRQIHAEITKRGLDRELFIGNTLVDVYVRCASLMEACQVFDRLPVRDAVSWNSLMTGYAEHGLDAELLECFKLMQLEGTPPDAVTFVCTLKACSNTKAIQTGQAVHAEVIQRGLEKELHVGNTLVDVYVKCNLIADARRVFEMLPVRDVVSWNALITGCAEVGNDEEVLNCVKRMDFEGVPAAEVTFLVCLKACGTTGALETGKELHAQIRKSGLETRLCVGNMLIDMYGRCGSVLGAREVFDKMPIRNVVSWTSMIKAYGENHEANMAILCFENMQEEGVKPDSITFTCLLAACSHANLVREGQIFFRVMCEEHDVEPTLEHYACMVDLFARSGQVHEAERLVAAMLCPPSSLILMGLLAACKVYGKVELGEQCFQQLVEVNQEDASIYLLMADMYAMAGRWSDAYKIEEMRKDIGAKKKPGGAMLEVNRSLHEFVVGINQKEDVVITVQTMSCHTKGGGYVPILDLVPRCISNEENDLPFVSRDRILMLE